MFARISFFCLALLASPGFSQELALPNNSKNPKVQIDTSEGKIVLELFADKAPATVNPSLWRHAMLTAQAGLFKVTDGIWQVRGFDIANMTLIEGKTGFIVVDTLTARESAAAALAFARKHLGNKPVSAIVFSSARPPR